MMQLGGTPTTTAAATTAATATAPLQSNNNDSAATEAAAAAVGAFEVSEEMHDRGFGGNRWPRQETLALLKIRSDMGIAFRDASVKGPLWEEVSRKMAELGYIRNAKKCKEKFENVYKYHKRTKEGRTGKSEGKTYRFFDQLEALESQSTTSLHHPQPQSQPLQPRPPQNNNSIFSTPPPVTTVMPPGANMSTLPSSSIPPYTQQINVPSFPNISGDFLSDNSTSSSSSYSTSSDMEIGGGTTTTRKKRKRKWKEFFERLMKQVVDKQEELQRKFLEAVEKREHERLVREESWRVQEIARINREHEILAQERSMSAAKDAAVMAFLQKLSEKQPNQPTAAQPQPQQVRPQMLDQNVQQDVLVMRKSLLRYIKVKECAAEAEFLDPGPSFILPNVACSNCDAYRDLDICRDPALLTEKEWSCADTQCGKIYDREKIESSLLEMVRQRERMYHMQDLVCIRCNQVKAAHLTEQCECSGSFRCKESGSEFSKRMEIFLDIAKRQKFRLLEEYISWILFGPSY